MNKTLISSKHYYFSSHSNNNVINNKLNELNKMIEEHNSSTLKKFTSLDMDSLIKHAFDEFTLLELEISALVENFIEKSYSGLIINTSFIYKINTYSISK